MTFCRQSVVTIVATGIPAPLENRLTVAENSLVLLDLAQVVQGPQVSRSIAVCEIVDNRNDELSGSVADVSFD